MGQDQAGAEQEVEELFKEFGPFEVNPKDIQRVKDAEKVARKRATNKGGEERDVGCRNETRERSGSRVPG